MNAFDRPAREEVAEYYWRYIDRAEGDDLVRALEQASEVAWDTARRIPDGGADHRYAEGKWTIKEVLQHVIDAERIFAYRALRFARNDRTALASFEENDYVPEARVARRDMRQLMGEHDAVRLATLELFRSFDDEMLLRTGIASGVTMSVRGLGWIIAGHALHHLHVINVRYLNTL